MKTSLKKLVIGVLPAIAILAVSTISARTYAKESVGEKIETTYDAIKKDVKKSSRKAKRQHRNAAGQKSILKDAGDEAKNAGDELEYQTKKVKRKLD